MRTLTKSAAGFVKQIRAYLANPGDHARELVVFGAILIVLLLLAFVGYLLIVSWVDSRRLGRPIVKPPKRRPNPALLVATLISAFVAVLLFGAVAPTQPSFCRACHTMRPAYRTWRASSHRRVGCIKCHQTPGAIGWMSVRAAGLRNLSLRSTYWQRFRPTRRLEISNRACLRCHRRMDRKTLRGNPVRVSHREFQDELDCAACHADVGHRRKHRVRATTVKQYCVNCHDGATAGNECPICHTADIGSGAGGREPVMVTRTLGPKCEGCHQADGCRSCHRSGYGRRGDAD